MNLHPVNLADGERLMFYAAQPTAMNLDLAEQFLRRAVKSRRQILGNLRARPDGSREPLNDRVMVDCIQGLQAGVVFAVLAIEAFANHMIALLPEGSTVTLAGENNPRSKSQMLKLELDLKLRHAVVLHEEVRSASGDRPWERYVKLRRLRNELIHLQAAPLPERADSPDAYGRLVLGEGDNAVETAVNLIEFMKPGFISDETFDQLAVDRPAQDPVQENTE